MIGTHASSCAVVSGCTSGIGRAAADGLLRAGWRVIGLGRTPSRIAETQEWLEARHPHAAIEILAGDLADLGAVERLALGIRDRTDRIDLLVNNAGATCPDHVVTSDGLEQTFAGNHLGPFLLTTRLLDLIRRPGGRVITVSSLAHSMIKAMQWDNLNMEKGYNEGTAYSQSKLANLLFTRELARRTESEGLIVQAVHPGIVRTNFASDSGFMYKFSYTLMKPWVRTAEHAAGTILWLAEGGDATSGGYFSNCRPARMSKAAQDDASALRLWEVSESLIAKAAAVRPG